MSWIPILLLAAVVFLAAVVVLKLPRSAWALVGAVLLLGLAGYALEGVPGLAGSPKAAVATEQEGGELFIAARRAFFGTEQLPSRWVVTGDGYARRGEYGQAAGLYGNAVAENPADTEAWLAMGIALVEHAEGNLTPAALHAFERAAVLEPKNGGARYFLGLSWLRAGEPERARELWLEAFRAAPEDAEWRIDLALRIQRLDMLMEMASQQRPPVE